MGPGLHVSPQCESGILHSDDPDLFLSLGICPIHPALRNLHMPRKPSYLLPVYLNPSSLLHPWLPSQETPLKLDCTIHLALGLSSLWW